MYFQVLLSALARIVNDENFKAFLNALKVTGYAELEKHLRQGLLKTKDKISSIYVRSYYELHYYW